MGGNTTAGRPYNKCFRRIAYHKVRIAKLIIRTREKPSTQLVFKNVDFTMSLKHIEISRHKMF